MPKALDDLTREMEAFGLVIDRELRWDGAVTRLRMADRPKGERCGWFIGKEIGGRHYAHFGDWRDRSRDRRWTDNGAGSPHCDEQYRELAALIRAEREREEARDRENAARVAAEMWAQASEEAAGRHPYVVRKGVKPHGLRVLRPESDNELLIPYLDEAGNIATVQRILPDGRKLLLAGGRIKGCCHIIPGDEATVYICEGWATGATISELTGGKVLVACSANNLKAVAETARRNWPDRRIVIAADNDHKTPGNPGLRCAREAAEAVGAETAVPEGEGTDFNDMAVAGFPGRAAELLGVNRGKTFAEIMRTEYPPLKWAVEGVIPEGLTILAGPPKFGKSWLMQQLCYDKSTGGTALGLVKTEKSFVIWLDLEGAERRTKRRGDMQDGYIDLENPPENMLCFTDFPRIGQGFEERLRQLVEEHPDTGLIVVDTLQKVRPVSNGKRNLYQAEYEDYEKLQKFAVKSGIPVVAVHHTRKRSAKSILANPFDEISGSTGIQGVADTLIMVCKEGDKGWMFVTGREVEANTYPMRFSVVTMTWTVSPPEDKQTDAGGMLLADWFKNHEHITAKEAAEAFNMNYRTMRHRLQKMAEAGELEALRPENPKDPVRYRPMRRIL